MSAAIELSLLCRLCLENNAVPKILSPNDYAVIVKKAQYCLEVEFQVDERAHLCHNCEQNLNNFYEFRQRCRSADKRYRTGKHLVNDQMKKNCSDSCSWKLATQNEFNRATLNETDNLSHPLPDETNVTDKSFNGAKKQNFERNINRTKRSLNIHATDDKMLQKNFEILTIEPKCKKQTSVQCEHCGKIFKHKNILKKHVGTHTGVKLFSCKLCHKRFTRAEHEIVHMRAHRGIRPFICELCARAFTKRQDLLRHMRIHSEEKNFPCPRCDRKFKRSGDVRSHMRSHTGDKPYSCAACNKSYSSHSGLKKHGRTHCDKLTDNTLAEQ